MLFTLLCKNLKKYLLNYINKKLKIFVALRYREGEKGEGRERVRAREGEEGR